MHNTIKILFWPLCICACVGFVLAAHAWKWPTSRDPLIAVAKQAAVLSSVLPIDSPVALRVVGLPEDYFNHLRYAMIPRPLERKMPQARRVVLLAADSSAAAAVARLRYERPDLRVVSIRHGDGFQLSFYKPEF